MGKLEVSGTRRYPEQIVDNVNPISVGAIYDVQRVAELQRQLQNTPYYASVAIDVGDDPTKPLETPVRVKVSEYPYNSIRGGVGYATDTGPQVQGNYSYLDTFGKAYPFTVGGRIDQIEQFGQIQLSMPPGERAWTNSVLTSRTRASTAFAPGCRLPAPRSTSTTAIRSCITRIGSTRTRWGRPPAARWCRHGHGRAATPTTRCSRAPAT
jgi:outer membrane translocation and assembly module TamA